MSRTRKSRVLNCAHVVRGEIFTAKEIAHSLKEPEPAIANLLNHLAVSGDISVVSKGRYLKCDRARYLLTKRWDENLKP